MTDTPTPEEVDKIKKRLEAAELLRQKQQGLGRPIISETFKGYRFIAVGGQLHYGKWLTFPDFLSYYIRKTLGGDWGNAEIAKPLAERHPIMQWYDAICRQQKTVSKGGGEVFSLNVTGAIGAYFGLAYNLYLLAHNATLQNRLIQRLKNPDQFRGAYYESLCAACFTLAGFTLALEDEEDSSTTHCEFTATRTATGNCYSLEAKARQPGKGHANVGNQLYQALCKEANFPRVVMIDINLPTVSGDRTTWMSESARTIKGREAKMTVTKDGVTKAAPPAYVLVTNHPYHYDLEGSGITRAAVAEGFKVPDFGYSAQFTSLRAAFKSWQRHADVISVLEAFESYDIPSTFSGELPDFEFGDASREFVVGNKYDLSSLGLGADAELMTGCVLEPERSAYLTYRLSDHRQVIIRAPLTDAELTAYRAHPESFFGIKLNTVQKIDDPLELFKFFYDSYKRTPRERILDFMQGAPDLEALKQLSSEDLLLEYCKRCTQQAGSRS